MAHLTIIKDGDKVLQITLERSPMIIGRGPNCDVLLPDSAVSRRHCTLQQVDDEWVVVDNSTSGTFIDGSKVDSATLAAGQTIQIGPFKVLYAGEPPATTDAVTVSAPADPTRILEVKGQRIVYEQAALVVSAGADAGKTFELRGKVAVVGKGTECDVVLGDPYISSSHFRLERAADGWHLRDLGSTNGTIVAGTKVGEALVPVGSLIELGETRLELRAQNKERDVAPAEGDSFHGMLGATPAMRDVFALLGAVAATDAPVLVLGESGTGKELAARAVHAASSRATQPFVPINSGGVSPSLVESEFFGHEKGAFTGADKRRIGAFERASRGTLFLDEIGELPLDLQAKLLRVLETGDFQRVGGNETLHADVRIVCATHRDLPAMVQDGSFREDLYYRVAVVLVQLPALRDRADDIALIARHLVKQMAAGGRGSLTDAAAERLKAYDWPGNVRELRNALQRALLFTRGGEIEASHIALDPMAPVAVPRDADEGGAGLEDAERNAIVAALKRHDGNRKAAAEDLGIARSTLHQKMKKYAIEFPKP